MLKIFHIIFIFFITSIVCGQKVGTWKVHLPFTQVKSVTEGVDEIWAATPSGLFIQDLADNTLRTFTTVNGLAETEVDVIRYHPNRKLMMVAYSNSNLDIIEDENVYHYPDILRTPIIGKKQINHIYYYNKFAYLSCSFGIARFDLDKREISESYQNLGPNGTSIEIHSVAILGDSIYAATPLGIIASSITKANLADYTQWKWIYSSNFGKIQVIDYNNNLIASVDSSLKYYSNGIFTEYIKISNTTIQSFENNYGHLIVSAKDSLYDIKDAQLLRKFGFGNKSQSIMTANGNIFMADPNYGVMAQTIQGNLFYIYPNGPLSKKVSDIVFNGNNVWTATSGPNQVYAPLFGNDRFSRYDGNKWFNYDMSNPILDPMRDFYKIAINPYNNKTYVGSFGFGLVELENDIVKQAFIPGVNGCTLDSLRIGNYSILLTSGLAFDKEGNLWVSNPGSSKPISKMDSNYQWESYSVGSLAGNSDVFIDIVIDDLGQKWFVAPRGKGILIFDEGGNNFNKGASRYKLLGTDVGNGALPSLEVNQVAKDIDGNIWAATNKGLVVFYSPANIFSNKNSFDAQRIVITVNGKAQWLFGEDVINCITVDAANRKWVGTRNGAYLISSDGQKILENYTIENSPLVSNFISRIAVNPSNGEVFFATDKGLVSMIGNASKGADNYDSLMVYPNPVKSDYSGSLTIKGLLDNSIIKITDAAGNIVNETKSNGGIGSWDLKNFNGERVQTGVYLIMVTNADASAQRISKVLVFH